MTRMISYEPTAPAQMTEGNPTLRPRRRTRWTVAALCALTVAGIGADRIAVHAAESRIADRISERAGQRHTPPVKDLDVTIPGFPFLPHAASDSLPRIRVQAKATTADHLPVDASIDLRDVSERAGSYTAATAGADLTAPFPALATRLGPATEVSNDKDRLRITREVFGEPLTVTAEVALSGDHITIRPVAASLGDRPLDATAPRITALFEAQERTLPDLPLGLEPTGVSVGSDGVTVHASAENATFVTSDGTESS